VVGATGMLCRVVVCSVVVVVGLAVQATVSAVAPSSRAAGSSRMILLVIWMFPWISS